MFIYLVVDNQPQENGGKEIIKVYINHYSARSFVKREKRRNEYESQYYQIERWKVE